MSDEELTERITIRCSLSQKVKLWKAAAKNDRRSLAEWIRVTLDDAAAEQLEADKKRKRS